MIIDPTNPVGPDGAGGYRKVIDEQESSGQLLAGLLPAGAVLVKAFGTLSAPSLAAAARREPDRAVLFYAADDEAAGDVVAGLIRAAGFDPVRRPGPGHPHRDVRRPARIRCPGPGRDPGRSTQGPLTPPDLTPSGLGTVPFPARASAQCAPGYMGRPAQRRKP